MKDGNAVFLLSTFHSRTLLLLYALQRPRMIHKIVQNPEHTFLRRGRCR